MKSQNWKRTEIVTINIDRPGPQRWKGRNRMIPSLIHALTVIGTIQWHCTMNGNCGVGQSNEHSTLYRIGSHELLVSYNREPTQKQTIDSRLVTSCPQLYT
jgi:hypothetical protein